MKKSLGEKCLDIVIVLIMIILSVIMLYPYLNQLAIALNDGMDTMMGGLTFYPRKPTWSNFSAILDNKEIIGAMGVTVFSAPTSTVLTLFVCVGAERPSYIFFYCFLSILFLCVFLGLIVVFGFNVYESLAR